MFTTLLRNGGILKALCLLCDMSFRAINKNNYYHIKYHLRQLSPITSCFSKILKVAQLQQYRSMLF